MGQRLHLARPLAVFLAIFMLAGLALVSAPVARAATTIPVNTTTDELNTDGDCSLREAIVAANTDTAVDACPAGVDDDTISIPAGNYVFGISGIDEDDTQQGDLDITASVTLQGGGRLITTVDANHRDRVFDVFAPSVVVIRDLTLTGGSTNSDFVERDQGGAIRSTGTLSVWRCIIQRNLADTGGGIASLSGALSVTGSTVQLNSAARFGGGIYAAGTLLVQRSTIMRNISLRGTGGGIHAAGGTFLIRNSTIYGNEAALRGGGIATGTAGTLQNATVAGNSVGRVSVPGRGGGIALLAEDVATVVSLRNTIVASNLTSTSQPDDCADSQLHSLGHNLFGTLAGCTVVGATESDLTDVNPLLAPIRQNGGRTQTVALKKGSPAIDAGEDCRPTDQRGIIRPQDGDANNSALCDIGAYEKQ